VSGALAKLADNTWQVLSSAEKKILQHIFIRIIKPSDTGGVTRRLADRDEFSADAWNLAQKLSSALDREGSMASEKNAQLGRLLKIKGDEGKVLELTHEALIHQWPKYQIWLKQVSKDNLKRTHDYVIEQNKIYQAHGKAFKFRLRGYELEQSEKLLDEKYKEYLSEEEIAFIEKSVFYRRVIKGLVGFTALLIIGLAGALYLFNQKIERVSDKLIGLTDRVVQSIIDQDNNISAKKSLFNLEYKIFDGVVSDFKGEKNDPTISVVVAKAWFGKGLILSEQNRTKEAIITYTECINSFKNSSNPKVLDYVARAWKNRGNSLVKLHKLEEAKVDYKNLVERFKNSKEPKILIVVSEAWRNSTQLYGENEAKQLIVFKEYFKKSKEPGILIQISKAYNTLAWLALLDKEYEKANEYLQKGYSYNIKEDYVYFELNQAHYYLLMGQVDKAKDIYIKHKGEEIDKKKWSKQVEIDFGDFIEAGIDSKYFNEVLQLIKGE
jgi:hypothetical protein